MSGVKNLECTPKMLLYVTVTRKIKKSSVSTSCTFPDWYASETFWRNKSWVTSLSQWLISSSNLVWPTLWPTHGYSPLGTFQTNRQHLKIVCYLSLTNNRLVEKITEWPNYRSIHLLDMFWKVVISKIDKVSSLKIAKSLGGKCPNF